MLPPSSLKSHIYIQWVLFPKPENAFPNAMMAFICEPQAGIMELLGKENEKLKFERADGSGTVDEEDEEDEEDNNNENNEDAYDKDYLAQSVEVKSDLDQEKDDASSTPPVPKNVQTASMLTKIFEFVSDALKNFFDGVKQTFKEMFHLLLVTVRCGVCVFCNLINAIVDMLAYIQAKAVKVAGWLHEKGSGLIANVQKAHLSYTEKKRTQKLLREKAVKNGHQPLGGYCKKDNHCQSNHCSINRLVANECIGSPTQKETRNDHCNRVIFRFRTPCEANGCVFKPNPHIGFGLIKDGECSAYPLSEAIDMNFIDIGTEATTWKTASDKQRLHRILHNMHRHRLLDSDVNHKEFIRQQIESPLALKAMMKSMVSMLQVHSTNTLTQRQEAKGILKLPNKCVSAANIGKTITLAINYENPDLVKVLFTFPWDFSKALPELLVAISPMNIQGQGIVPECLIAGDRGEGSASKEDMEKEAEDSMKRDVDEDVKMLEPKDE